MALDAGGIIANQEQVIAPRANDKSVGRQIRSFDNWWPTSHSFFIVLSPEKYFSDHPEWYSLIDGERTADPSTHASLCLTNRQMRRQYLTNTLPETQKDPFAHYAAVGAPDDSGPPNMCQCPDCLAARTAPNPPAALLADFTNEVAAAYSQQRPDLGVFLLAYHHYRKPPTNITLLDNVIVMLCSIECSGSVPVSHERNRAFHDDLQGWLDISKHVFIYNYGINFSYEFCPHPNLRALAADIRYYAEQGVEGIFTEGGCGPGSRTAGYGMEPVRTWMLTKLMWNPYLNPQDLIEEFCHGYYGPAGKHILAYVNLMHDAVEISGDWLGIGSPTATPKAKFLSIETLTQAWSHLTLAETAVRNDKVLFSRVQAAQLPVLFTFMVRWNKLQYDAECRGIPWPLGESIQQVHGAFIQVAAENNITVNSRTQKELAQALQAAQ